MTQSSSQPVSPTTVARNPFIDPASDRNHFPDFSVSLAPPSHGLQGSDGDDCDGGADGGSPDVSETEEAALKMDWSIDMQAHIAVLRDKEGNGMLDLTPGRLSEQANDIADAQLNEHAAADAAKVEQFWHKALHTRQGKRGMNTPAYEQGRFVCDLRNGGESEHAVHHFHGLYLGAIQQYLRETGSA